MLVFNTIWLVWFVGVGLGGGGVYGCWWFYFVGFVVVGDCNWAVVWLWFWLGVWLWVFGLVQYFGLVFTGWFMVLWYVGLGGFEVNGCWWFRFVWLVVFHGSGWGLVWL